MHLRAQWSLNNTHTHTHTHGSNNREDSILGGHVADARGVDFEQLGQRSHKQALLRLPKGVASVAPQPHNTRNIVFRDCLFFDRGGRPCVGVEV